MIPPSPTSVPAGVMEKDGNDLHVVLAADPEELDLLRGFFDCRSPGLP